MKVWVRFINSTTLCHESLELWWKTGLAAQLLFTVGGKRIQPHCSVQHPVDIDYLSESVWLERCRLEVVRRWRVLLNMAVLWSCRTQGSHYYHEITMFVFQRCSSSRLSKDTWIHSVWLPDCATWRPVWVSSDPAQLWNWHNRISLYTFSF